MRAEDEVPDVVSSKIPVTALSSTACDFPERPEPHERGLLVHRAPSLMGSCQRPLEAGGTRRLEVGRASH